MQNGRFQLLLDHGHQLIHFDSGLKVGGEREGMVNLPGSYQLLDQRLYLLQTQLGKDNLTIVYRGGVTHLKSCLLLGQLLYQFILLLKPYLQGLPLGLVQGDILSDGLGLSC